MTLNENKNIFQVYITESGGMSLPPTIADCVSSINQLRGEYQHIILSGKDIELFLADNFDKDVLWAYNKLKPFTYRADLARYCLVYKFGGWYFDITTRLNMRAPNLPNVKFCTFREPAGVGNTNWGVNTAVFYATRSEKFLENAIIKIVEHCRDQYYGSSCLNVTGPGLFGKMLALFTSEENGIVGDCFLLTPSHPRKNLAYVFPDGQIFAWGKATAGTDAKMGLEAYGAHGTNSYVQMWAARDVYDLSYQKL